MSANERWFVPQRQPWRGIVLVVLLVLAVVPFMAWGAVRGLREWLEEVRYAQETWKP